MKTCWGPLWGMVFFLLTPGFGKDQDEIQKSQFEAAFQGRCGHGSPCEQICFELHDGMYECDCRDGFILRADGYSCSELNSTASTQSVEDLKLDLIYEKDAEIDAVEILYPNTSADSNEIPQSYTNWTASAAASEFTNYTTVGPRLEQKLTSDSSSVLKSTLPISTARPCILDCGPGGGCHVENDEAPPKCLCPLGRGGDRCEKDMEIQSPRFTGSSWLAFPALRGAYKHVQLSLELRPEAYDGIFFLTGERDDMAGDFMALLLYQGFVEFRFDCGSGIGVVRSDETILLNQWNHVTLYRHRWDAWLQLNNGKHVQGRSKGLFSRITFREPLFIGGPGNTTGLDEKLPVTNGLKGCIRHLEVNDHVYKFALDPSGEAIKGYGIEECTADRCSKVPCQHGGKCLTSETSAVCLCPLGFSGDLCEIRVDLQVPSFNGSSHLRYRGLAETALTWLDLEITFKPTTSDGLIIYNGHRMDGTGDFMGLYLNDGFVEFAYDLGTGSAIIRSNDRLGLSEWHEVRLSRTGRLAILTVDNQLPVEVLAPGAFTQLSLPQNLYLGGVPNFGVVSPQVRVRSAFVGCIQKVQINGRAIAILAEALGGANVDNCPHPCVARPCGEDGECVPEMDYFTCRCKPGYRDHLCSRGPPSFHGIDSFFHLSDPTTMEAISTDPLDINVRFKSNTESGLLLWAFTGSSFVSMGLKRGALELRFTSGYREDEMLVVHNSSTVNDGLWHRVKAVRDGSTGLLIVDNGPAITRQSVQIRPPDKPFAPSEAEGLFIGGMPHRLIGPVTGYRAGIRGCIADLVINTDYHLGVINRSAMRHNIGECEPKLSSPHDIQILYLYNNHITNIDNLEGLCNVTSLYLQNNQIHKVENMHNLSKLKKLYLSKNKIGVLEGLECMDGLEELYIEKQELCDNSPFCFDPRTILGLSETLQVLNISHNNIISLTFLSPLKNLVVFDASYNDLDDKKDVGQTLRNWYRLKEAKLIGNPISKKHRYREDIIANTYRLEILDNKNITDLTRTFIRRFEEGKLLCASKPSINFADVVPGLPKNYSVSLQKAASASIIKELRFKQLDDITAFEDAEPVYLSWNILPKRKPPLKASSYSTVRGHKMESQKNIVVSKSTIKLRRC